MAYQMRAARFPHHRDLTGFAFDQAQVDEALVRQLHELKFVDSAHNVVFVGGPGTGKTHLATSLGIHAIRAHGKRFIDEAIHARSLRFKIAIKKFR